MKNRWNINEVSDSSVLRGWHFRVIIPLIFIPFALLLYYIATFLFLKHL
jgi:hypothetical protein